MTITAIKPAPAKATVIEFRPKADLQLLGKDKPTGLAKLVRDAVDAIKGELALNSRLVCMFSSGKDSSVSLALTLMAMKEWKAEGHTLPTLHVAHSDTLVENPMVSNFSRQQLAKIKAYAKTSGLPIKVWIASPTMSHDYLVSIIGGRIIASVGNNTKCQQIMKAAPLASIKSQIKKWIVKETGQKRKDVRIVSIIGTRFDESTVRGNAMQERGESATEATHLNTAGRELTLSPVANFTTMDIFEFIGTVTSGQIETYDTWEDLLRVYRDLNGGDCAVVAYLAQTEVPRPPCSARTGCWTCLRVSRDKSADNMLADEEGRYNWMQGLNDLRGYIQKRHFDPTARCWLSRSVQDDGTIKIAPNSYAPEFTRELLGICLTLQRNERVAAAKLGIDPRFVLLTLEQIIAIDCLWARYGYQQPFTAMRIFQEIEEQGGSVPIPNYKELPDYTSADVKFAAVAPFCDDEYYAPFNGLRNLEAAIADCESTQVMKDGTVMTQATNQGDSLAIDQEGAWLFYEFDLEHALEKITILDRPADAIHYWLGLGTIQFYKGGHADYDRMIRMSNQIHRSGLKPFLNDPHALLKMLKGTRTDTTEQQLALFD